MLFHIYTLCFVSILLLFLFFYRSPSVSAGAPGPSPAIMGMIHTQVVRERTPYHISLPQQQLYIIIVNLER